MCAYGARMKSNNVGGQQTETTTAPVSATPACVAGEDPEFLDARGVEARFSIRRSLLYELHNCGRFVPRNEIVEAVKNALGCAWQPGSRSQPNHATPKWPSVNQEQREAVIASGFGLVDLWEFSNPRIDDDKAHTEQIIDRLFR